MIKVKSNITITFPKLGWAINAGETRELPESEEAQARILQEPGIEVVEDEDIKSNKSDKDTK